jgi:cytochrome P450
VAAVADVTSEPKPSADAAPAFNPFAPGFADDPYPHYAELSAGNPVQRTPLGWWAVFRHDDCTRLLRDPTLSVEDRAVTGYNPRAELRQQVLGDRQERGTRQMLNRDPPDHTRLRRLVQQAFTPRVIERLAPNVQAMVDDALDRALTRGGDMDVIADLAFPLPFRVITELLGMPPSDEEPMRELAHTLTLGLEPLLALEHMDDIVAASDEMTAHVLDAIAWKRRHPADDVLSALIAAEDDGDRLTPEELLDQVMLLYVAGHETTVNLIGNGTQALLTHPDQLERWHHDPSLGASAVDELLRFDAPVQFSRRVTTAEVDLGDGRSIEAGVFVLTCLAAANRDPAKWGTTAAELDLGRPGVAQHLAFGAGVHHCLGASLARLEGRIALGTLARRFPRMEATSDAPAWNGRLVLRGLDTLPVHLGRRAIHP